jgi:hypothetical protein
MPQNNFTNPDVAFAVTPSNTQALPMGTQRLYIGTAGNLNIALSGEGQGFVLLRNLSNGSSIEAAVRYVAETDTTASNIVAFI